MTKTQFFKREYSNLEEYKNNFKKALQMIKTVKLFDDEVISFLNKWIASQKSYIPREDVDNLLDNMKIIFKDKSFYDYCLSNLSLLKNNENILEYSFNLISKLDDLSKGYKKIKEKLIFEENLKKSKNLSQKEDEEEMKKLLWYL